MVFITGDCHGDFQRFGMNDFPRQRELCREDYIIICGDFGGVWNGSREEVYWLDWLEAKPFTTLFVDGNHENFHMLNVLPRTEWHGGKVHQVRKHILHLMRGQVFEINGQTWFTMGGAQSHDTADGILDPAAPDFKRQYGRKRRARQQVRVLGRNWWPEEMPTDDEYQEAMANLDKHDWRVDCVLTHCAPSSVAQKIAPDYRPDDLTDFLEIVKERSEFGAWFFGHYHDDCEVDEKFILQWKRILELGAG